MTLDEWISHREPAPPQALADRIAGMTRDARADAPQQASDALLSTADQLLAVLLPDGCRSRKDALDLLVADALVTYAFEAAAEMPDMLEQQATIAMTRLAAYADAR